MKTLKKTAAGTLFGSALLFGGGLGLAHATPSIPQAQAAGDGLVDVAVVADGQQIGIIQSVKLVNAVSLVNSVCPISGITDANLNDLDANGTAITQTCLGAGGLSFTFIQNGENSQPQSGGRSELAPGHTKNPAEGQPPSATPTTPPGQVGR